MNSELKSDIEPQSNKEADATTASAQRPGPTAPVPITIEALADQNKVSYERLPMAEIVFDRLARIFANDLRNLMQATADVELVALESVRLSVCLEQVARQHLLIVFRALDWDNLGLIAFDAAFVQHLVEVMLGGRHAGAHREPKVGGFTSIESNIADRIAKLILRDLTSSFAPLAEARFKVDRIENDPRFATIGPVTGSGLNIVLQVRIEERIGHVRMILPFATLEPIRDLLLQQFMGEKFGRDRMWETHLAEELRQTEMDIEAVLDEQVVQLDRILHLNVGDTLEISRGPDARIVLRSGDVPLFSATPRLTGGQMAAVIDAGLGRLADGSMGTT